MSKKSGVLPGDKVAVSEEFLPGRNVYDDYGVLRALNVGKVRTDRASSEISVESFPETSLFSVEDYITGQVEVAQTNSAGVRICYLNGKRTDKGFTGSLMLRSPGPPARGRGGGGRGGGGRRAGPAVKLGDIVRCRIVSLLNGMVHLSINEDDMGVVYALCSNCGKPLMRAGSRVKCDECGNVEERKLAADFGQTPIQP
jgi:exosome complex component CSL4